LPPAPISSAVAEGNGKQKIKLNAANGSASGQKKTRNTQSSGGPAITLKTVRDCVASKGSDGWRIPKNAKDIAEIGIVEIKQKPPLHIKHGGIATLRKRGKGRESGEHLTQRPASCHP
jgi:hypothetical protein